MEVLSQVDLVMQNPNLQQIPARDPVLGPMIRSLFIPEQGCKWGCFDYSQQEPRLVAHYALRYGLPSVNTIADSYDSRFVNRLSQNCCRDGRDTKKSQAKVINLDCFMVWVKLNFKQSLGVSKFKAEELI